MSGDGADALTKLRKVRERLARPETPAKVDLRQFISPGSAAWDDFVRTNRHTPGYRVKRATIIRWLDEAIGKLEGAVLDLEGDERVEEAPLPSLGEPARPEAAPPADEIEPPSPRDVHRSGDRASLHENVAPHLDVGQMERELIERASENLDGDDLALAGGHGLTSIGSGLDDWYYGPEYDDAAREERAHLNQLQREERARWWAEQQARNQPQQPAAQHKPASPAPTAQPVATGGTPLRQLTPAGIERAQEFLANLRENPSGDREPPHELLHGQHYSRPFSEAVRVEPRAFRTRREAGEHLSQALAPVRHRITDHPGVWSWLGMYYFAGAAPEKLSPNNMTFLFEPTATSTHGTRSDQQRYRHYLWGSWRLYEQHGHHADFILGQSISSWDDITERVSGSRRVFNSIGLVPLILRLYTRGSRKKRGHVHNPGGLRHLLRVLPQLELTYDIYGMEPDALLEVLPEPFREWDRRTA